MIKTIIDQRVLLFCGIVIIPLISLSQIKSEDLASQKSNAITVSDHCKNEFSDVTYSDLKNKLELTLAEKNKTLVNLDFKTLQAQVDILSEHLLTTENMENTEYLSALKKTATHLNELEELLAKAKDNAKQLKENHIIPLATMASLKSEYDNCRGVPTQFDEIFKQLSRLNKDFTEIQMISPQKIIAQKKIVNDLIEKLEEQTKVELNQQSIASHLNFIQNQINTVTTTFRFDIKILNIANLHAQQ